MPARRMVFSSVQHLIQLLARGIKETQGSIPGTDPVRWVQNEQTCRLGTCRPAVVSGVGWLHSTRTGLQLVATFMAQS